MRSCMGCGEVGVATAVYLAANGAAVIRVCKPCLAKHTATAQPAPATKEEKGSMLKPLRC